MYLIKCHLIIIITFLVIIADAAEEATTARAEAEYDFFDTNRIPTPVRNTTKIVISADVSLYQWSPRNDIIGKCRLHFQVTLSSRKLMCKTQSAANRVFSSVERTHLFWCETRHYADLMKPLTISGNMIALIRWQLLTQNENVGCRTIFAHICNFENRVINNSSLCLTEYTAFYVDHFTSRMHKESNMFSTVSRRLLAFRAYNLWTSVKIIERRFVNLTVFSGDQKCCSRAEANESIVTALIVSGDELTKNGLYAAFVTNADSSCEFSLLSPLTIHSKSQMLNDNVDISNTKYFPMQEPYFEWCFADNNATKFAGLFSDYRRNSSAGFAANNSSSVFLFNKATEILHESSFLSRYQNYVKFSISDLLSHALWSCYYRCVRGERFQTWCEGSYPKMSCHVGGKNTSVNNHEVCSREMFLLHVLLFELNLHWNTRITAVRAISAIKPSWKIGVALNAVTNTLAEKLNKTRTCNVQKGHTYDDFYRKSFNAISFKANTSHNRMKTSETENDNQRQESNDTVSVTIFIFLLASLKILFCIICVLAKKKYLVARSRKYIVSSRNVLNKQRSNRPGKQSFPLLDL